jgi:hypothetical protein
MAGSRDIPRRDFVLGVSASVAVTAAPASLPAALSKVDAAQLLSLSAGAAVARMSCGEIRAELYAGALLERCKRASALNAVITLDPERVLEAARAKPDCSAPQA